ncbi:MAG: oligosaccharyl transferase subunit ost3/OST6 [Peltula sp. TS41687]|nr:MAG: oligosaccharyl transferase subunit ost3/OST6 [Peltula sp. TS41687]
MKLLRFLSISILPLTSLAAKRAQKADRFEEYHSRSLSSSPLKLDDSLYDELTATPRNYSAVLLLTALDPRFGCQMCRDVQPQWDLLAKSWVRGDRSGASRVLYGTLDFNDGKGTFQRGRMPNLMANPYDMTLAGGIYDSPTFQRLRTTLKVINWGSQPSAESLHAWVSRHVPDGPRPPIVRPINYTRLISITTVVLGLITVLSVAAPYLLPVIRNRNLWAAISIIAILMFTSGHMFNHIRKVPYVAGDGKGGISYFAGGFTNQFGMESQILATIYGVLAFATVSLALKVPRMADPRTQQVSVIIWSAVMLGAYSFLLSVFKIKNPQYPFWLPPF